MIDLVAKHPASGLTLPYKIGEAELSMKFYEAVYSIAPFQGQREAVSAALYEVMGVGLPADGHFATNGIYRVQWSGFDQYMLLGALPVELGEDILNHAALTDQSDAWVYLTLLGEDAPAVLARLCPLDLRDAIFKEGMIARTEIAHMMAMLSKTSEGYEIAIMSTVSRDFIHHVKEAMESINAQRKLPDE